ncbi:hypothetical protein BDP27DRAFT_1425412 [Rhodocollybia butyracea]|uniref:Uncharacterized protein n=1 Tax=Rhodocollybia butyracea TaxID=206335 RepID=A0A9P5PK63_9AGAR|nr:hypothetical protein BDP27DRAFT_1425412 [Rhodocollybia butyracea]
MSRPNLYRTSTERKAANRLYQKKHYQKNHLVINEERRQQYAREHENASSRAKPQSTRSGKQGKLSRTESIAQHWLNKATKLKTMVEEFVGPSSKAFCDNLVERWLSTAHTMGGPSALEGELEAITGFHAKSVRYYSRIMGEAGPCADETVTVGSIKDSLQRFIRRVEDLTCCIMEDPQQVRSMYQGGHLRYQRESDVMFST